MSAGHQYPLFRLACIGKQGIGAFDYHSNIKDIEKTFQQRKNVTLSDIKNQIIKVSNGLSSVQDGEILLSGRTLQGAYPKVSLDVSEDGKKFQISDGNNVEGFEPWILKFPHKGKETHPDNDIIFKIEYVYNQMASECGLRVPETKLLDVDGNSVFATKRFDRTPKGKIPMMSLCGMMEIPHSSPSGDYTHVADCLLALKADKAEFHEAFKQMIFNSIFCNRDDHTKI